MRTETKPAALAGMLLAVGLASCDPLGEAATTEPPDEPPENENRAALAMGSPEERTARAPYSPPGWPLKRGDLVADDEWDYLLEQFGGWHGIEAPFRADTLVFGADWRIGGTLSDLAIEYLGHYPERTVVPPEYWESRDGPPQFGGDNGEAARAFHSGEWPPWRAERQSWTEERWIAGYAGEETSR